MENGNRISISKIRVPLIFLFLKATWLSNIFLKMGIVIPHIYNNLRIINPYNNLIIEIISPYNVVYLWRKVKYNVLTESI